MSAGKAQIGQPAPDFKATAVVDGAFKDILLSNFKGKYVVLFFYPLDFTFVCPTEIVAFSDRVDEFRKINCEVIGVSVDSHFSHLAWINTPRKQGGLGNMKIPLVADLTKSITRDYGVLKEDDGVAYRGLFVIDDKGIVRQITINDLPVGRSVDETLRLVHAFQHTDKYGEVCPAGWKPGSDTIIPDVEKSQAYFSKQQ
ncbi:peroxiredoxin-2 [Thalassophryne amazonica]|uniref:peroxiredoxin-2 n=1 Tax=Thalassophryne amazonica TaxID=390379 RepID=UPI0014712686|nr:peroxiredoxin-2 [Thalassophryne amazonica]